MSSIQLGTISSLELVERCKLDWTLIGDSKGCASREFFLALNLTLANGRRFNALSKNLFEKYFKKWFFEENFL